MDVEIQEETLLKHRGEEKGEQILPKVIQKSDTEEETADDELKMSRTYRRSRIELRGYLTKILTTRVVSLDS